MESNQQSPQNPLRPVIELLQGGNPDVIASKYNMSREELEKLLHEYQESRRQMALANHLVIHKAGRNDPCPCGSGKKYKKCCLPKHEEARKRMPPDRLQEMEEQAKRKERLEKDVEKGFDLLFSQEFEKAQRLAERLLESYPDEDRLHDITVMTALVQGDYDRAFHIARERWQVAQEEKAYYQENGFHKRKGAEKKNLVYFYSPSTWLEKFWIAQRARVYRDLFPSNDDQRLKKLVDGLKAANDPKRFPGRQEEGYEMRRRALAGNLDQLEQEGPSAIPYLLPLTYSFSWASLFIPDLLYAYGSDESILLLAELSMFRFPYFAQKCLVNLEKLGDRAIPVIEKVLSENPAFDELKVGLISVLGNLETPESFRILVSLTEHENPYIVNFVAQALGNHKNPEALPYLEKARERVGELSKIAGAIKDLAGELNR
ncbi:MAG: hypothetical protein GX433_09530 [Deltaproteobacteria bacterium]|nr:hypothetical protein [Deltaproteobacteria bacterium]